jgi:CDP-diacylglycerol--glycerol-3-phosphate 3-phosphatidyltransferase
MIKNNLPNILSFLRIFLAFFIFYLVVEDFYITAFIIFILAALSDFFDGYLARSNNWVSDFGKIIDPIADKTLILVAFLSFYLKGLIHPLFIIIIAAREIFITVLRLYFLKKNRVLPAREAGKLKTVLQISVIIFIFLWLILEKFFLVFFMENRIFLQNCLNGLMLMLVVVTLSSMYSYLKEIRKFLKNE